MKSLILKAFLFLTLTCAQDALADDLYRCGNTYQDTPCKGAVSKPINEKPPKKPAFTITPIPDTKKTVVTKEPVATEDTECKKRGEDAKVIAKLRELGVTANDQTAIATNDAQKALIKDIYGRSGSSFQVQNAVERECLQKKQKTTLASSWMAHAKRLLGIGTAPAKSSAKSNAKPQPTTIAKAVPKPVQPQVRSTADPKPVVEPALVPATQPESITQPEPQPAPTHSEPTQLAMPAESVSQTEATPVNPPTTTAQVPEEQEDTQGICSSLKAGVENIANQRRSKKWAPEALNELKQQQLRLESTMKAAGC